MISLRKKKEIEEVSAASMSDIAFLLLVFFMVTAVFFVKEGLDIDLPRKKANAQKIVKEDLYKITIIGEKISLENKLLGNKRDYENFKQFQKEFRDLEIPNIPEKVVLIRTEGKTPYGNMIHVLSTVQIKGFKKISVKRI